MRDWIKVILGVVALSAGASAPTLIIETLRPGSVVAPNRPSPGTREAGQKSNAEAQPRQHDPDTNSALDNQRRADNNEDGSSKSSPDWWFNGGLILVGLLQLYVFGKQAQRLKQSVDLTREIANRQEGDMRASIAESARAATAMEGVAAGIAASVTNARELMDTQRQFGKLQMRPYISVIEPGFIPQNIATPYYAEVQLIMVNTGHTPAHNIRFAAFLRVLPAPLPNDFDFTVRPDQIITSGHINPGQRLFFRRNVGHILPAQQYAEIIQGRGINRLYIYGTIFFDDVFGDIHQTNFCSFGVWDTAGRFSTRNTPEHNNAT